MTHSVLLDTSFFIRLLNDEDTLHENAKGYFKYFLDNNIVMNISTISIAEYCVLESLLPRAIIPNDSKLFAQADVDNSITHFITSDKRSQNTFRILKGKTNPKFEIIDISVPHDQVFGILDFKK